MSILSSFGGGGSRTAAQTGSPLDNIIAQFTQQTSEADAARKAQFENLIKTIKDIGVQTGGTFDQALARIEGLGDTARERTTRAGERTLASGTQGLISSGLLNTTIPQNLERGVSEDTQFALQGIDESVGLQQSGILTQQAGSQAQIGSLLANAIQGQNISGPDLGLFAQLIQQAAAAGDPNQGANAFVPPTSAAVNAPSSVFQRPDAAAQQAAANIRQGARVISSGVNAGGTGFQTGGAGGPSGTATTRGNVGATRVQGTRAGSGGVSVGGTSSDRIRQISAGFSPFGGNRNLRGRLR